MITFGLPDQQSRQAILAQYAKQLTERELEEVAGLQKGKFDIGSHFLKKKLSGICKISSTLISSIYLIQGLKRSLHSVIYFPAATLYLQV